VREYACCEDQEPFGIYMEIGAPNCKTDMPREYGLPALKRRLVWFDLDFVVKKPFGLVWKRLVSLET
jgi:hypothetical protein